MSLAPGLAATRLIVNADDLGLAPEVDRGIEAAAAAGAVTSATLLVTGPAVEAGAAAARRLRAAGCSVGLHVDLVTGRPAAPAAAAPLAGADGGFLHDAAQRRAALDAPGAVAAEVRAQAARFERLVGAAPSHLDSHKHTHRDHPAVRAALIEVARRTGIPVRSPDAATRAALRAEGVRTPDAFVGDVGPEPYWTLARLLAAVAALRPGTTELMCHPGLPMERIAGLFYVSQRAVELDALTDSRLPAALGEAGVRLVTFAAIEA